MPRKQILYHATTPENAEEIRKDGLCRMRSPFVCLSEKPTSWWKPGLVVLKVRITGLTGEMKTWLPESDEINYWGDINPERISRKDVVLPRRFVQNHFREATKMITPTIIPADKEGDTW